MEQVYVSYTSLDENKRHAVQQASAQPETTQDKLIISNERPWKPWQPARSQIRGEVWFKNRSSCNCPPHLHCAPLPIDDSYSLLSINSHNHHVTLKSMRNQCHLLVLYRLCLASATSYAFSGWVWMVLLRCFGSSYGAHELWDGPHGGQTPARWACVW